MKHCFTARSVALQPAVLPLQNLHLRSPPVCQRRHLVRLPVRRQVGIMAKGGGFVFQQVHNVLANVPPENIVAMFDAVRG